VENLTFPLYRPSFLFYLVCTPCTPMFGKLFFLLVDEMADITFNRSLGILMAALMASLQEILKLSDEQLTAFTADFEARLPEYLRNALHPEIAMA